MNWNFDTSIIVQGIAQSEAAEHLPQMIACGTKIVAGVSINYPDPELEKIPVFPLVEDAIKEVGNIETSVVFMPPYQVLDAGLEAIASGIKQLVIVTRNVPPLDTIKLLQAAKAHNVALLGAGSAGIMIPEKLCLGSLKPEYFSLGNVGIIGYGKALIYEVAWVLKEAEIGQSMAVALGKDKIIGSQLIQWLEILNEDESTDAIVLIQSVKDIDHDALKLVAERIQKPIICYVAGIQTPAEEFFREGLDIVKNYLYNSVVNTNSDKKNIALIKKSGLITTSKISEIPQLAIKSFSNSAK